MDKLDELRLRYQRSLPDKARDIRVQSQRLQTETMQRPLLQELQQQVHRLSGSAPAYGFDAIGALARPVDVYLSERLRGDAALPTAAELFARIAAPLEALVAALEQAALDPLPPAG